MSRIKSLNFHETSWPNVYRIDGIANVSQFLKCAIGKEILEL